MKYALYDILLHILLIVLSPYFVLKMITVRKYGPGLTERFGFISDEKIKRLSGGPVIWTHAVSVGETKAVLPLLKSLKRKDPDVKILFSTVTKTGNRIAEKEGKGLIDSLIYFPLDISWVVRRVVNRTNPTAFIVVEKEVWPNLFNCLKRASVPIVVVNGTLSDRSFKRYLRFRFFFSPIFAMIDFYAARTDEDRSKAVMAGVREERAVTTGNIKFDLEPPGIDGAALKTLKAAIGAGSGDKVIVAGSTHPGEEDIMLSAFKALGAETKDLRLVIAPRHPERFDEVESLVKKSGLKYTRRSRYGGAPNGGAGGTEAVERPSVVLLDTIGELMTVYSLSTLAIVGGSFVENIGGHNLLEPAYFGKPVLYGPYLSTYLGMAEMLEAAGGGIRVNGPGELTRILKGLLANDLSRAKTGASARRVVEENRGAMEKTLNKITELLNER
jgi:3-deoxy-D-manno-octulosonic-acid transferase